MTKQMTRGVLTARVLALAIAAIGFTLGPGGGPGRAATANDGLARAGGAAHAAERRAIAWDDGSDSGDGGDGDDGGDDE